MSTDCKVNAVIFAAELVDGVVFAYANAVFDFNAGRKNTVNILVEVGIRQAVAWYSVAEHTAKAFALFKNGDLVTRRGQRRCYLRH